VSRFNSFRDNFELITSLGIKDRDIVDLIIGQFMCVLDQMKKNDYSQHTDEIKRCVLDNYLLSRIEYLFLEILFSTKDRFARRFLKKLVSYVVSKYVIWKL
jgi:hypothetical protein